MTTELPQIPKPELIDRPTLPEQATVASQMTGLLSKESPYMKQAATQGAQRATQRGLLNSTMGIQAAESARINAALPIAQQDAATNKDSALSYQNYQQAQNQLGYQGQISSTLQGQQDAAAMAREKLSQDATTFRTDIENQAKLQIASMQLQQGEAEALQNTLSALGQQYEREYSTLLSTKDFASESDRQTALTKMTTIYKSNANLAAGIAGVTLQWT